MEMFTPEQPTLNPEVEETTGDLVQAGQGETQEQFGKRQMAEATLRSENDAVAVEQNLAILEDSTGDSQQSPEDNVEMSDLERGIVQRSGNNYMVTTGLVSGNEGRNTRYAFQDYLESDAPEFKYSRITLANNGGTFDAVNTSGGHFYGLDGHSVDLSNQAQLVPITDPDIIAQLNAVRGRISSVQSSDGGGGDATPEVNEEIEVPEEYEVYLESKDNQAPLTDPIRANATEPTQIDIGTEAMRQFISNKMIQIFVPALTNSPERSATSMELAAQIASYVILNGNCQVRVDDHGLASLDFNLSTNEDQLRNVLHTYQELYLDNISNTAILKNTLVGLTRAEVLNTNKVSVVANPLQRESQNIEG